jgi:PAS domain S-box-containing protein
VRTHADGAASLPSAVCALARAGLCMNAITSGDALRVLLVEDNIDDCELLVRMLRELNRPIDLRRVSSEVELRRQLSEFRPEIVLSDYSMPGFSGSEALRIVRQSAPLLPFIFVSGTIGEEAAIEALQGGAVDYVLKDNLRRLPTAVLGALATVAKQEEIRRIEQALRESEERFRAIVESTEDWIWETDLDGRITYSNRSVVALLGRPLEDIVGHPVSALVALADREPLRERLDACVTARCSWRNEVLRWQHGDGSVRWLESTAQPRYDEAGTLLGFRGIDRDVTQRVQQQAKIRQLARFHAVLSALGGATVRVRDTASLLDLACRLAVEQGQFKCALIATPNADGHLEVAASFGDAAAIDMIRGLGPADPASPAHAGRPSVRAFVSGQSYFANDYEHSAAPALLRSEMARVGIGAQAILPIGNPPWALLGLCSEGPQEFDAEEISLFERMASDIDYARDFISKSDQLAFLAYHDPVSGLPNSAAFQTRIAPALASHPMMIGALHVVRFRHISDSRGREFGEKLLAAIGARLASVFTPDGWLAHAGADEFIFARAAGDALSDCLHEAEQLVRICSAEPLLIGGERVYFAMRCGLAVTPEHGVDFDAVESHALSALVEARRRDQTVVAYSEELRLRAERRILLDRELRFALERRQFELFLQPKFDARTRGLSGAEALLRWRHPQHGLISPAEFIPLLEDSGLIIATGRWVIETALALLSGWRERGLGDHRIAVNVSARELRQQGFADQCRELIGERIGDHGLDIEVTESLLIEDIAQNIQVLNQLRDIGCRIAIDDFGTGYSSLNYLSRLPVDVLKIDQSFTSQIANSPETLALVTNIISLGHSLNLRVVAEGVEDEEQEKLLRLLRCDELQGYLLGRPMPVAEFEARLLS